MSRREQQGEARRRDRESGQAMVEFALILFPLLTLVAGIIWFGIGLNYWLDMQRIANQGARLAAVNCGQSAQPKVVPDPCTTPGPGLAGTLKQQALTNGLESSVCVRISYPAKTATYAGNKVGDPVMVSLESPFTFVPILNIGTITLGADATMRLELTPQAVGEKVTCP